MSAETAQQNGAAADKNAQAKADVDGMLAQLQAKKAAAAGESSTDKPKEEVEKSNGASGKKDDDDESYNKERRDRDRDRERSDPRRGRGGHGRGRGGGRGGFQNQKRNNNRFDPSTQGESDDPVAIRKQVEFYFSDSNLPLDKFLLNKVGGTENNAVDLETICSFKRMRHFKPRSAIVTALKESSFLDLIDDDTKIKRKVPLSEELANGDNDTVVKVYEDRAMPRSIYAKGFGEEQPSTQFDIEAFFAEFGHVNAVRLRRKEHDKSFKGSVFVEFDSEETMKRFMEVESKPKYKGNDLQIMSKKEYCDKKAEDISAGKIRASSPRGGQRRRDDRDWRERRADDNRKDKRRGGHGYGSKGGRDRDHGNRNRERDEKERETNESNKTERDVANTDAVAKAKALVEAENAKETTESKSDAVAGQKRAREEDGEGSEREAKKVDAKSDES